MHLQLMEMKWRIIFLSTCKSNTDLSTLDKEDRHVIPSMMIILSFTAQML